MAHSSLLGHLTVAVVVIVVVVKGQWIIDYDTDDEDGSDYNIDENELLKIDLEEEEDYKDLEEKPCSPPPQLRNGETRVWGGGLLLEYICKDNYNAVGPTHGACDLSTGHWTIDPPLCVEDKCPALPAPHRGVINIDQSGGVATFACRHGYHLVGSRVLLCEAGAWTGVYPVCAVSLDPATSPSPISGKEDEEAETQSKGDGLSIEDSDETCFHSHVEPPTLDNAVVDLSYVMNEARGRYVMVATYTCYAGYKLLNDSANQLYCRSLKWEAPQFPKCVASNDPCQVNNGGCEHGCVSSADHYACTCYQGFTLGANAKDCVDVDECEIDNGGCEQECHNTHASYFCSCVPGYTVKGPNCVDVDECKHGHQCPGACVNTPGGWQCNCSTPGYRPSSVPTVCEDIDECAVKNGGCADLCINKRGSYKCRCEQRGRRLGADEHSCEDINECERYKNKACRHGTCYNTDGSYVCTCDKGFVSARDDSTCLDVDECEVNKGGCHQACNNTQGSFHCACYEGYTLSADHTTCIELDECTTGDDVCEDGCVNLPGSFTCICSKLGHVLADDKRTCVVCSGLHYYDDSTQACLPCPANSHAVSDAVALSLSGCICDAGFRGSPADMKDCKDVDECADGALVCFQKCVNTPGSAYCACQPGYRLLADGTTCEDIDECDGPNNGTCSQVCVNLAGSYRCECVSRGYELGKDGRICNDIDECKRREDNCTHKCYNTAGSYVCLCPKGFYLNGDTGTCQDINECFLDESPCQHKCNNTIGSFECSCYGTGWRLSWDHSTCHDINECMEGDNPCPDICINSVGSYMCDCNRQGYRLAEDSSGCMDVDECENATEHGCEQVCVNLPGSFKCDCHPGYRRFGPKGCQACPEGMYRPEPETRCMRCPARSTTNGTAKGSAHDCICEPGYQGNPGAASACVDFDECSFGNFGCQHRCYNTPGSAYCTCNAGYRLSQDRKNCDDVDECAHSKGRCQQLCVNTQGSYACNCTSPGYTLNRNGYSCDDVDECQTGILRCEYRCVNSVGSATCTCPSGYQLQADKFSCGDRNECENSNGGCEDQCVNIVGGYECKCIKPGFRLHTNKRECVDINECLNKSLCDGYCENLYGSYRCHCPDSGTELSPDGHTCRDVDECSRNHTCQQLCRNKAGGYECDCFPGYHLNSTKCVECPMGTYRDETTPSNKGCQDCPPSMTSQTSGATSPMMCLCKAGYSLYPLRGKECLDINECAVNNGGCDHVCQNSVGSFQCTCRPGYELNEDGKGCFRRNCATLEAPQNGHLVPIQCQVVPKETELTWLTPGTVCSYKCQRGHVLTGDRYRTCLENGTWTGESPACDPKMCSALEPPTNGFLLPKFCREGPVPFRKRCKFSCRKGYLLRGKSGAKCLANQRWSTGDQRSECVKGEKAQKKTSKSKSKNQSNEVAGTSLGKL